MRRCISMPTCPRPRCRRGPCGAGRGRRRCQVLRCAPQGASCELSLPPDLLADGPALVLAALRRLGLQPVLVGGSPILGRSLVTAGRSALAAMAAAGVPKAQIAAALEGFGAAPPDRLPDPVTARRTWRRMRFLPAGWLRWRMRGSGFSVRGSRGARRISTWCWSRATAFRAARGGPMHLADRRGLMALRADLRRWAGEDPLWTPAPFLDRLIRDGLRLETLDQRV